MGLAPGFGELGRGESSRRKRSEPEDHRVGGDVPGRVYSLQGTEPERK